MVQEYLAKSYIHFEFIDTQKTIYKDIHLQEAHTLQIYNKHIPIGIHTCT